MKTLIFLLTAAAPFASALPQGSVFKRPQSSQSHADPQAIEMAEMGKACAAPPSQTPKVKFGISHLVEKFNTKINQLIPKEKFRKEVEEIFARAQKEAEIASSQVKLRPDLVQEYFKSNKPSVLNRVEKTLESLSQELSPSGRKRFEYITEDLDNRCECDPPLYDRIPGYMTKDKKKIVLCPLLWDDSYDFERSTYLGNYLTIKYPLESTCCGGESKITTLMNLVLSGEHGIGHQKYKMLMGLSTKQALDSSGSYVMFSQAANWEAQYGVGECSGPAKQKLRGDPQWSIQSKAGTSQPKKIQVPPKAKLPAAPADIQMLAPPQGANSGNNKGKQKDI